MPTIEELLDFLASRGIPDEWQPAETIESGGGTIPKTSSKGIVRSQSNDIIELGPFARIMAQYAMRDRAAVRAASTLGGLALDQAALAHRRLDDVLNRHIQVGRVYIANKFVIRGLQVSPGNGRSLNIAGGTMYAGGRPLSLPARTNAVAAPTKEGTYVVWLDNEGNPYLTEGSRPPEGGLALARVTVPAGDTDATFSGTIADIRPLGQLNSWTSSTLGQVTVTLPYPMPDTQYEVFLHLEGASDPGLVALAVLEKTRNAFVLKNHGQADDIVVRWMAVHTKWR